MEHEFLDANFEEHIIPELSKLVSFSFNEFKSIYKEMRLSEGESDWGKEVSPEILQPVLKTFTNCSGLGIDLPIWFNYATKENRLMVIGRDPQRNHKDNKLVMGSPFGLATKGGRQTKSNKYWNFVEPFLKENTVYLTDVFKLFVKDVHLTKQIRKQKRFHYGILQREIELFKPNRMVALGKEAQLAVKDIITSVGAVRHEIKVFNLPHLSPLVLQGITVTAQMFRELGELKGDGELKALGETISATKDRMFK